MAPRRDAPHSAQNFPAEAAPHEGQVDLEGAFIDAVKVRAIQRERLADRGNEGTDASERREALSREHMGDKLGSTEAGTGRNAVSQRNISRESMAHSLSGATSKDIVEIAAKENVRFLRLQFTDILGVNKNVEIPRSQFEKALAGDILFDGSSIQGFVRIEESDMLLVPDLATFRVFPWGEAESRVARLICDISMPDGRPFDGDPRRVLKRQIDKAASMGFTMNAGMEAEFFMFKPGREGEPTTATHDVGGYFDLAPADLGEDARRAIVAALEQMGFEVEASHHEVAHGQHEIDFRYADALTTADNIATFRFVVKYIARQFGLVASFMPKPIFGQNGSGMHTHQSLFRDRENAFWDPSAQWGLSTTALHYIGGLLQHARGFCAITNPLVNSYKRLVPGYEAPVNVAWSMQNRSPLIRVPARREAGTRVEVRMPDPSANPYLALAVMLAAGLDGVATNADYREPVDTNIFEMSHRERRRLRIDDLPHDLNEACDELEKDEVIVEALGSHVAKNFLHAKRQEWHDYITQVTSWELENYLLKY